MPSGNAVPKLDSTGHRRRLRARMERATDVAMEDHELLELLLTFSIPRADTKPLARTLLDRFEGLAGVFSAECSQILELPGLGPRSALLLSLVRPLSSRSLCSQRNHRQSLSSPEEAARFFHTRLGNLQVEQVHAAFVNARNMVVATDLLQEGTVDHSIVYPRKVLERALHHKASGFILAHNHPSGDSTPSSQDLNLTKNLEIAARAMGVRFLDHLIIGEGDPFSFQRSGLLS
jgi:DNA repair protein RadC